MLSPSAASADVSFLPGGLTGSFHAICHIAGHIVLTNQDDCNTPVDLWDPQVTGVYVGPNNAIVLDGETGDATFNGGATFNGNVGFTGNFNANQINTTSIVNSGSLVTGSVHAQGDGSFAGALSADSVHANSATFGTLHLAGAATFDTNVAVGGKLTVAQSLVVAAGATIDAGGNRIQNVGTPIAGTDAANKDYVDTAIQTVAGNVTNLTSQVSNHETRITAVEATNVQQDTRLTNVENVNTVQDTRLTTVENINTVQDTRLTSVEAKNVSQDSRMTAIEAVNTIQSSQIGTLQGQVGDLQNSVNGLHRDIRRANAGIAAAVALGGTMVVPDSPVSISFNLATYRGEQGFSGSVVGRLSRKVYVNAGFGGSTQRGSTAGRVGISFGL